MTSTNFNIGLADERNSSRVLRPPGGGHTDIFGINEVQTPAKKNTNYPKSEIKTCFIADETDKNSKLDEEKDEDNNGLDKTEQAKVDESNCEQKEPETSIDNSRRKGRIPPGGFSTALW